MKGILLKSRFSSSTAITHSGQGEAKGCGAKHRSSLVMPVGSQRHAFWSIMEQKELQTLLILYMLSNSLGHEYAHAYVCVLSSTQCNALSKVTNRVQS